jgi:hypothetical protein
MDSRFLAESKKFQGWVKTVGKKFMRSLSPTKTGVVGKRPEESSPFWLPRGRLGRLTASEPGAGSRNTMEGKK